MENSISHNRRRTDNTISGLAFCWHIIFTDGTYCSQFEGGEERSFKEVQDRIKEVKSFMLYNKQTKDYFTVDLTKGLIKFNSVEVPQEVEVKKNIRLIYFRRVRIEIGQVDLKEKSKTITYFLGFQYNDKNENNRQIVLQIDSEGNFVIGA